MIENHSKEFVSTFRNMSELDAYNWILERYPPTTECNAANAMFYLSKRSWRKDIQSDSLQNYLPLVNGVFFKYVIDNLVKVFNYGIFEKHIIESVKDNDKNKHFAEYYLYGKSSRTGAEDIKN